MIALEQEIGKPSVSAEERKRVREKQKHATMYESIERKQLLGFLEKEEMGNKVAKLAFRGIKKVVNPVNSLGVTEHKNGSLHQDRLLKEAFQI